MAAASEHFRYQNASVLGTVVGVDFELRGQEVESLADEIADAVFAEIERLQAVFSAYDSASELCRWRAGEPAIARSEFSWLMARSLEWQQRTRGLFNPLVGELTAVWIDAAESGRMPDEVALARLAEAAADPGHAMVDGRPVVVAGHRLGVGRFNLNAMAKGHVVDRAAALAHERYTDRGLDNLLIDAGGDLKHRGSGRIRIGIENPLHPYDNAPPLTVIEIGDQAVATSGGSRRGFAIGGERFSHVIDPRSGRPAAGSAAVTVVAATALEADVVATAASVLPPGEAVALVDELAAGDRSDLAALAVGGDGRQRASRLWMDRFGAVPG